HGAEQTGRGHGHAHRGDDAEAQGMEVGFRVEVVVHAGFRASRPEKQGIFATAVSVFKDMRAERCTDASRSRGALPRVSARLTGRVLVAGAARLAIPVGHDWSARGSV